METIDPIAQVLKQHSTFVTIAHSRMDADALGSVLGIGLSLERLGKTVQPVSQGNFPAFLRYMPGSDTVLTWEDEQSWGHDWLPEVVIVLDIGGQNRVQTFLDQLGRLYPQPEEGEEPSPPKNRPLVLNIDHHVSNEWFGDYAWVDGQACATAEMVVDLLRHANLPIDGDIATALYSGILADTGSFHHSNTTPRAMRIAADLVDAGADPSEIARAQYRTKSEGQLKLQGLVLQRLQTAAEGRLVWSHATIADITGVGLKPGQAQDLVNALTPLATARLTVFFLEIEGPDGQSQTKISFRGEGYHNLSEISKQYGGGGHPRASGATLQGPPEKHIDKVIADLTPIAANDTEQRF